MDLLQPFPVALTVDYSTRCNLRCSYCTTGSPAHADIDMPEQVLHDIAFFCRQVGLRDVWLSCSGETTMALGWEETLQMFLGEESYYRLHLNSNFARPFTDNDLDALNKFEHVQVSIDSSSPELIKKQRTADLRTIVYNVVRFRQTMIKNGRSNGLQFNATITRDNITHLEGLASLALLLGVQVLIVTEVSAVDNPRMPDTLDKMTEEEALAFAKSVFAANNLLRNTPTRLQLQGALLGKLLPALADLSNGVQPQNVLRNFKSVTREVTIGPCTQPWDTVMVMANGNVKACCGSDEVFGNAKEQSLFEILDGPKARDFRARLLEGGPDIPCVTCPIATAAKPPEFKAKVEQSHAAFAAAGKAFPTAVPVG